MAQFFVILSDMDGNTDWMHPTEIEATDKRDAMNAITSSCPPESIKKILTAQEYKAFLSDGKARKRIMLENASGIGSDNFQSGADFFANMLNMAEKTAENESEIANSQNQSQIQPQSETIIDSNPIQEESPKSVEPIKQVQQVTSPAKYFTDNGIMFKMENGILYKKCWETVELTEITEESTGKIIPPEYRIINTETGKPVKTEKYGVQHLVWKELDNI